LDPAPLLGAAGLARDAAHPRLPWQIVSAGTPYVIAPLRDGAALARLAPDATRLREGLGDAFALYLCAVDPAGATAHARALTLDHAGAVLEDPATGSAAGPLLAHLHAHTGVHELTVTQGIEVGRPSELRCALEGERVRVGGDVVIVAQGTVWL
ncbi:MAG TPA: PhzF family phenazine biosynthesis protein, partial [Solirubrobacteraceae bacterium]|nr:PhzF family phenazine biosynthesis protein [Solirubrobacteraceae bacterium]